MNSQWSMTGNALPSANFARLPTYNPSYGPQCRTENWTSLVKTCTESRDRRSEVLTTLSIHREGIPDLAVLLWENPATVTVLLSEILAVLPQITATSFGHSSAPVGLSQRATHNACNVLALFQCLAGDDATRRQFVRSNIPMYLFPFLHTTNQNSECERLKVAALGIIGNLVRADQPEIIEYLLNNEFFPLCLRILKFGQDMSKLIAAYIIKEILSDPAGKTSICGKKERLDTVLSVLTLVLGELLSKYSKNLARNIIACYQILLTSAEARRVLAETNLDRLRKSLAAASQIDEHLSEMVNQVLALQKS